MAEAPLLKGGKQPQEQSKQRRNQVTDEVQNKTNKSPKIILLKCGCLPLLSHIYGKIQSLNPRGFSGSKKTDTQVKNICIKNILYDNLSVLQKEYILLAVFHTSPFEVFLCKLKPKYFLVFLKRFASLS